MVGKKGMGIMAKECAGCLGGIWLVGGVRLQIRGVWLGRGWTRSSGRTKSGQNLWGRRNVTQQHSGRLSCL